VEAEVADNSFGGEAVKKFLHEFKQFAMKGNVLDMAVGVIIGGAFSKIVTSMVNDLIMPVLGIFTGRINVADLKLVIRPASETLPELAIGYGNFVQTTVDFLIIGLSIFVAVRLINKLHRKEDEKPAEPAAPPPPPPPSKEELLLSEIRDLLRERRDIA